MPNIITRAFKLKVLKDKLKKAEDEASKLSDEIHEVENNMKLDNMREYCYGLRNKYIKISFSKDSFCYMNVSSVERVSNSYFCLHGETVYAQGDTPSRKNISYFENYSFPVRPDTFCSLQNKQIQYIEKDLFNKTVEGIKTFFSCIYEEII